MWKPIAQMLEGSIDAVAALANGRVAQPREMIEHSLGDTDFNGYGGDIKAVNGRTIGSY